MRVRSLSASMPEMIFRGLGGAMYSAPIWGAGRADPRIRGWFAGHDRESVNSISSTRLRRRRPCLLKMMEFAVHKVDPVLVRPARRDDMRVQDFTRALEGAAIMAYVILRLSAASLTAS